MDSSREPMENIEALRNKGNECFAAKNWQSAIQHYTECIEIALLHETAGKNSADNLLLSYSNRAETWLQLKEFMKAIDDSNKALKIDPTHLKSLFRKARALHGVKQYDQAYNCLQKASKIDPTHKQIEAALKQCKRLHAKGLLGNFGASDFLLPKEAVDGIPQDSDFFGFIEIKMTEDGRGRGIFATADTGIGELLILSSAIALGSGDPADFHSTMDQRGNFNMVSQENLVRAVVERARTSQKSLRQIYSLDDRSSPERLTVPDMELFQTDDPFAHEEEEFVLVDENRIRDVLSRNLFSSNGQSLLTIKDCSGLWVLPSFANHSCLPNSGWRIVGNTMIVHAARPIKKGEEITISYFDTLVPLPQREEICQGWGFTCNCERCTLERSLQKTLKPVIAKFKKLHDKALEESDAAKLAGKSFPADLPDCAQFAELFVKLENIITSLPEMKAEKQKWIRASFVTAYLAGTESNEFFPKTLEESIPSGEEVMEAIQSAVPGDIRTLIMVAIQLKKSKQFMGHPTTNIIGRRALDQSIDASIRVFGKLKKDVLQTLITVYSKRQLF